MDAVDANVFESLLTTITQRLATPLTPFQASYLEQYKQRVKNEEALIYMMRPDAYVVEVMCETAATATKHGPEAAAAILEDTYRDNMRRAALMRQCLASLK